ncbi:Fe-S cluster assembly protein SufD [Salinisphaera sp. USBA-960]|nr:Fe-S cluster assembly protein SufD [Salifodinibacter halophilus]NNC26367.1 Fe-S cluster assembly protein SufD [Salifodinibacter halophilus]
MTEHSSVTNYYRNEYGRVFSRLPGGPGPSGERQQSLARFVGAGFPHARMEDWKYTSLQPIEKRQFRIADEPGDIDQATIDSLAPADLDAYRVVVIDGRFDATHSKLDGLPSGADIVSLADDLNNGGEIQSSSIKDEPGSLSDLNTALVTDGVVIRLAANVALDKPVHLVSVASANEDNRMHHIRHRFELGTSAEATVVEHYVGLGEATYFTNVVTEAITAANAKLTRCRVQQEGKRGYHIGSFYAHQRRDSRIIDHAFDFGGRLVRTGTNTRLAEDNSEIHLYGVYAPTGRQHIDNHTRVDHATEHGISREIYKGVLDGHGRGIFNGKIIVHPHAQKTDSDQAANALLLSDNAEVDAKPELEIYADDVTCGHGSTVGQLDENVVFYLKSRGVGEDGARAILTYSFANALVAMIGLRPLEQFLEAALLAKLPGGQTYADLA